jgi:hydroxypyruvate reductase|tara:strand:- start:213 stop:1490 length:1278 start_codon:yes stop_codon:yes gene_type:complete
MIKNFNSLANTKVKRKALQILDAGLTAAQPKNFLKEFVKKNCIHLGKNRIFLSNYENIFVVAYGKAADSMAEYVSKMVDISEGIIVIPKNTKLVFHNKIFKTFYSGHPLPDMESVRAGKAILELIKSSSKQDFVLFLVSGGGSSLLALPDQITLSEKKRATKLLLECGATIDEFNCVRKHLSMIKGGKLVQNMNCHGCALVMSDVVSNDLSVISSGCTYYDNTTFSDALDIIKKYSLEAKMPEKIVTHLKRRSKRKKHRIRLQIQNKIIATNQDCLNTMAVKSRMLGFTTKIHSSVKDDVSISAKKIVKSIPKKRNSCLIFGGEPTVKVVGSGKGGRNQELVLQILKLIHNSDDNLLISSVTTDGIDGNTTYSGALIENRSSNIQRITSYLKNNDSNSFFKKYGGLIKTGPTHTNLIDVGLIIKY